MIAIDDGPAFIFAKVRLWLRNKRDKEFDDSNEAIEFEDEYFGTWKAWHEGITCPYCAGVWLSLPLFFMLIYPTQLGDLFLILMSISGGQAFLQGFKK